MATEENFEFNTEGKVTVAEAEVVSVVAPAPASSSSVAGEVGIGRIAEMIADPEASLPDIMRLIALEMAEVMRKMTTEDPLLRGLSMRDLNDQIKAYRELQKTLTESDSLSKKDTLNLDGPKFRFIFMELIRLFKQSLHGAGIESELTQNIMLQFGDLVKANDESLRRELNKIESGR